MADPVLSTLRTQALRMADRAYAPYSLRPESAVFLVSDGGWIPGVRVENASFPLLIPALVNAYTTAVTLRRTDILAVVMSRRFSPIEHAYLETLFPGQRSWPAPDALLLNPETDLPRPRNALSPFLEETNPSVDQGLQLARQAARRAHVPHSHFPVGAVLETRDHRLIPGCNVEHDDWLFTLCAERNALGTARSYGIDGFSRLFLSCLNDPSGAPCGSCRQVLVEWSPGLPIYMDRGEQPPACSTPADLLPDYFSGAALLNPSAS